MKKASNTSITDKKQEDLLFKNICSIWEAARDYSSRSVNSSHVCASWLTGMQIVEFEQQGLHRGAYGTGVLKNVSEKVTKIYGSGFSVSGLQYMRAFYIEYPELLPIQHPLRVKSTEASKQHAVRVKSNREIDVEKIISFAPTMVLEGAWKPGKLNPNLSWTHYRTLLKVKRMYWTPKMRQPLKVVLFD